MIFSRIMAIIQKNKQKFRNIYKNYTKIDKNKQQDYKEYFLDNDKEKEKQKKCYNKDSKKKYSDFI